jgi:hypothetical protein
MDEIKMLRKTDLVKISSRMSMIEETDLNGHLKKGHTYLVKESKPKNSFDYFKELVVKGNKGLCISRQHPKRLEKIYLLRDTSILWLTTAIGENYINPGSVGILTNFTVNFIEKYQDHSAVIVDGLEYILTYNKFEKMLKSIYFINEVAEKNKGIVIIPLSPEAFNEKNLALMERYTEAIEPN